MGNCCNKDQRGDISHDSHPSDASSSQSNQPLQQVSERLNADPNEIDVSYDVKDLTLSESKTGVLPPEDTILLPSKVQNLGSPQTIDGKVEQQCDIIDGAHIPTQVAVKDIEKYDYMDFTFLKNMKTISHITKSKVMFIMRGLSGSGKSTIVKVIQSVYKTAVVCSADNYFMKNGEYKFKQQELTAAHSQCLDNARQACESGCSPVIIDNTNVKCWEMVKYFKVANSNSYTVILVVPQTPWMFDAEQLASRNNHGVGVDVLSKKVGSFEQPKPIYWGWFVNLEGRKRLYHMIQNYFELCLNHFSDFPTKLSEWLGVPDIPQELHAVYTGRMSEALHCTAFYAGLKDRAKEEACSYASDPNVIAAMHNITDLEIIGFNFTVGTAGAQVRLDSGQILLWHNDDVSDNGLLPEGSKAHITLGVTDDVKPVQTGIDQLEILKLDHQHAESTTVDTADAKLVYFPEGYCHVQLVEPFKISSIFSAVY